MNYDFSTFTDRVNEITAWLEKEFSTIRTGRANPALLDSVQVDSYGAKVPINQIGSIGIEDPRTLRISVWDSSQTPQVERALIDADLGVSVSSDASGVRLSFPELTGERRDQLIKMAKSKLEEARVSLRTLRDDVVKQIEKEETGDDEKFTTKETLQKKVDAANDTFNQLLETKRSEILI